MSLNQSKIDLSPPHIGELEKTYVTQAFDTNWVAPLGPNVDAFEAEFASYVGIKGAVALSSGTAAIHLALRLLEVKEGDIVFCSSLTFVASANPILYEKATPVFIDSEPNTWNMSAIALRTALEDAEQNGKLPKAVIVVHLYGQNADMDPLLELCHRYGVPVIEDAAESLGATYYKKSSGTLGKFGIYSFNGNKIITTSGGGMLVSDDLALLEQARFLATQARDQARHYEHSQMGFNYRMSNVLAGIGRGQLAVLPERIKARREVFQRYEEAFKDIAGVQFMPEAPFGKATRWLTAFTVDSEKLGVTSSQLVDGLMKVNVGARPVWKPLHLQPLFSPCKYYPHRNRDDIAASLFQTGLCIPSGSNLSIEDQIKVIEFIKQLIT